MEDKIIEKIDGLSETMLARVKSAEERVEKLQKDAELNQKALDSLLARNKDIRIGAPEKGGIEGAIQKALQDNERDIQRFIRKETTGDLNFQVKAVGDMSLSNVTDAAVSVRTQRPGIITNPQRKQHLGELLPRTSITGDLVYLKDNGPGEGSIAQVAENTTKPQIDFDLIEVTAPANYIAGWARVSRRFMTTVAGATEYLTQKLTEAYYLAEDGLLLNGTGTAPQMLGLNTSGNFTAATSLAAAADFTQLVLGVGQLAALERNPDLIILHPDNLYSLMVNVASGSGEYTQPGVVQLTPDGRMSIAGVPVISTTAQTAGTYTIIDRSGILIGVLEGLNVRFFEQDGDNVRTNKITVRVESNIALAVFATTYVVKGTF